MNLFLTGTDTGVGKTHTAVQLLRAARTSGLRCAGLKPICCGDRDDAERLLAASSEGLTIDEINPVWLKTPAAPLSASLIEQVTIDEQRLVAALRSLEKRFDFVLVEGVGGWLVPIRRDFFVSDLAAQMKLPVMVIAQNRLGCLNHTSLTVRSVTEHGLVCAGVVLNDTTGLTDVASNTNADILRQILDVPILPALVEEAAELTPEWQAAVGFFGHTPVT
ncbi:MAG TPA: dethiobiotin synthase [Chthoniobacterales bacterium]|nr:dethiobiotin synthase [Chthoniobacterales bacterium]